MGNTFEMNNVSAVPGDIVSLEDILIELGIGDTATAAQTVVARAALTKAQGAVIRHLHYNPLLLFQTEFYPRIIPIQSTGKEFGNQKETPHTLEISRMRRQQNYN